MKRLLCILSNMNAGGAETFLMKLYRCIDRESYQMDFCINTQEECFYESEIKMLGGKIFRIPSKSENYSEFKKELFRIITENKYKNVLRIASNGASFVDIMVAKKAGAEVCAVRSSNSSDGSGVITKIAHRVGRILYGKYIDVKIAPSDLAAKYTFGKRAYVNGEVKILHNAIDVDYFRFREDARYQIRKEFNIGDAEVVIGHIGRFMTQKNHIFLLDFFKEFQKVHLNSKLLLVGNGELEDAIRNRVVELGLDNKVIFAGIRKDIPELLSAMDVFAFPSLYEGMPNTVIEAQATGLPCIISESITREANVSGLVTYLPIDAITPWIKATEKQLNKERIDTSHQFIEKRYDIKSQVEIFTKLVF